MKLLIDNLDGRGGVDYTVFVDAGKSGVIITRELNTPAKLRVGLIASGTNFGVPVSGAWVMVARDDGSNLFTGYLTASPSSQYLGWIDDGPQYRYELVALSDVMMLDLKVRHRILRLLGGRQEMRSGN